MGNFLDAVVKNVETRLTKKLVILNVPGVDLDLFERNVRFKLPRPVDIQRGDAITFYQGVVRLSDWQKGAEVTHRDYIRAIVFRNGRAIYEFDSSWMRKHLPVYKRFQENESTISAPFPETSLA